MISRKPASNVRQFPQKGSPDRRVHPRISFQTELWLGQDGVFARSMARLNDVSIGGARIVTREAYQIGSILNLRFAVTTGSISATAIVRNAALGSVGVEFLDLSPDDRMTLEAFISGEPLAAV